MLEQLNKVYLFKILYIMFGNQQNDKIRIVKANTGEISDEIKARVDSRKNIIYVYCNHIPHDWHIEDGDYLERELPGDRVEKFTILDKGYQSAGRIAPERYECLVTKGNTFSKELYSSVTYNLHGDNSRVYNNSVDNSKNVISSDNGGEVFVLLNKIIEEQLSNNSALLDLVKDMERSNQDKSFISLETYQKFIAQAANHMTLFSPFIPVLTEMLK